MLENTTKAKLSKI